MGCAACGHERPNHRDARGRCLALRCGCLAYVAEEAPVSDDELRLRIRARLASGALPRELPDFASGAGTMLIRPGRGQACTACDGAEADVTYRFPNRDISFHRRCDEIWGEERQLR